MNQPHNDSGHSDPAKVLQYGVLKNGLRVYLRPLEPGDRKDVADGFAGLSERSRFQRFLTGKRELSDRSLDRLVTEVDHHHHEALALIWPRHSTADVLLGDGRFIIFRDDPTTADVAVTIADRVQGLGAGSMMIQALARRAREEGVTTFAAAMLTSNEASHRMMRSVGRVIRDEIVAGLREVEVDISS